MKKLSLSTMVLLNVLFGQKSIAQSCPIYDAFKAIPVQYISTGNTTTAAFSWVNGGDSNGVPGYLFNCVSIWNESTGRIENFIGGSGIGSNNIYGEEGLYPYCQCNLQGPLFRMVFNVIPNCDYSCPQSDPNLTPTTNINNSSFNWSVSATWLGNAVPDMSTVAAVFITKPTSIDMDVAVSGSQWLVVGNSGNATINPGVTVTDNSIIQVRPNGQLQNNGTLQGNGEIEGSFINNSVFAPGNSPGTFTISGDYTATGSASHNIELASTLNDSIVVGGNAVLNGQLNISLYNGFVPIQGQAFTLLTANSVTGTFSNIVLPSGVAATVNYNTGSVVLTINNIVLPLRLLSFSSNETNQNLVQLNWQTTNEINSSHFIVQRSGNGTTFDNIGRVEARNTSGSNDYSVTDASPIDGVNFYRLQIVDIDSKTTYSSIIKIVFSGKSELQVFPNPAKNVITLSGLENKGIIKIIAPDGKLVKQLSATANSMLIDISILAKGMYMLQYNNGSRVEQVKIIKQ